MSKQQVQRPQKPLNKKMIHKPIPLGLYHNLAQLSKGK